MQRITRLALMLSVLGLAVAGNAQAPAESKESKELHGTWQAIKLEADGETGPKDVTAKVRWIFKGNEYVGVSPEMNFKGTYTINPTKKPKEIDLLPAGATKAMLAIYRIEGEQLMLCIGQPRPSDFVTKEGSGRRLYILKRVKD